MVESAEARGFELPQAREFEAASGKGVRTEVEGRSVAVGSLGFAFAEGQAKGADLDPAREKIEELQVAGNTVVAVTVDGEPAALIALADRVEDATRETVERLGAARIEPVMLTGDNERTAKAVAGQVGISEYRAEALPEDKAAVVRDLQEGGHRVATVGDGINDTPALMQADLGIAMEAADIVLTGDRLLTLVESRELAGRSYRLTLTNVVLALSFNGVGVLAAFSGLVAPVWAMLAMAASVSLVLVNSFAGRLLGEAGDYGK